MGSSTLYQRYQRLRTLHTHRISTLPVVILMPHSACNCRCVMCDIWKGNSRLTQLHEQDILDLLNVFRKFHTRQVVMSGGEAILNPDFFRFCEILNKEGIKVCLLTAGLTLERHAYQLVDLVDEIIVSLDGDAETHNRIRNIPQAFEKLRKGIESIYTIRADYKITGRSVIHKMNFRRWPFLLDEAEKLRLKQISFLPADISSEAFNRPGGPATEQKFSLLPAEEELPELNQVLKNLLKNYKAAFENGFIAESPVKLQKIVAYYAAFYGLNEFPYKRCNAPWVSAVVEADGTVRPCFFHPPFGNIHDQPLDKIVNSAEAVLFRKHLNIDEDETCRHCVCSLYLSPGTQLP